MQYKSLIESLKLIACSYEEQIEVLPEYVVVTDEIISTFYDSFLQLPGLIECDMISRKAIAEILRCFNWIDILSRQQNALNIDSLKNADLWQKARILAKNALDALGENQSIPDLSHIQWTE